MDRGASIPGSTKPSLCAEGQPGAGLSAVVLRPRLLRAMSQAAAGRLTLVVAPAGYGKTTLLTEWLGDRGEAGPGPAPTLWYPRGELDNDPAHLLDGLVRGIQARFPNLTPAVDRSSPPSYSLALLFQLAAQAAGGPWLLVLDDYHLITNPAVHQALDTLLGLPRWPVHLVIASRGQPPLAGISRLRVEGRLSELDEADLRFTSGETQTFLAASSLALEEGELRQVLERTEGWPAALQLVCQAARRETYPDLGAILGRIGDERPLFDYLAGQVLDRQPAAIQDFLRRTALLPYLSAELCNAFLEIADAASLLDMLERQHLFISPLADRPGRRYHYHALFQDFLRRCLAQVEGAAATEAWQRRAAACFLEAPGPLRIDDRVAAIEHLLAARDWATAVQAIDPLFETLDWG